MYKEDRRHVLSLMLICYEHHQVTNNVSDYPVDKLKKEHEERFSRPARAILDTLKDWTTLEQTTPVNNLESS